MLYFSFFTVLSSGATRFYSLFLRERNVADVGVGVVLSASDLASVFATPVFAACVDANGGNPAPALMLILVMTPLCFACQAIGADAGLLQGGALVTFFAFLRFSISAFLVPGSTLLDGLAMSAVRTEAERSAYGTERLWGAVSWAIVHLLLGLSFDAVAVRGGARASTFGQSPTAVLYPAVFVTSLGTLLVVWLWQQNQPSALRSKRNIGGEDGGDGDGVGGEDVALLVEGMSSQSPAAAVALQGSQRQPQPQHKRVEQLRGQDGKDEGEAMAAAHISFLEALRGQLSVLFHSRGAMLLSLDVLLLNACTTVVEGLCFLYFSSLGASYTLMGVSVAITVSFGESGADW